MRRHETYLATSQYIGRGRVEGTVTQGFKKLNKRSQLCTDAYYIVEAQQTINNYVQMHTESISTHRELSK